MRIKDPQKTGFTRCETFEFESNEAEKKRRHPVPKRDRLPIEKFVALELVFGKCLASFVRFFVFIDGVKKRVKNLYCGGTEGAAPAISEMLKNLKIW